jgi:hypothetical protein
LKTFAHIVNPVDLAHPSDLAVAQPITFASMIAAAEALEPGVGVVELLSAQYPEDRGFVPEGFGTTPDLERSVLDLGTFKVPRKLPLLADIIGRMYDNSDADWLIYTNVDIALQPHFYSAVASIIDDGFDAFVINRRTISSRYTSPAELPEMYAQVGTEHPGYDCFVFHRSLWPKVDVDRIVIGMPGICRTLFANLAVHAENFVLFRDLLLTFHVGDDGSHRDPMLADMRKFNRQIYGRVWQRLRPGNPDLESLKPKHLRRLAIGWRSFEKAVGLVLRSTVSEPAFDAVRSAYRKIRPPDEEVRYFAAPASTSDQYKV